MILAIFDFYKVPTNIMNHLEKRNLRQKDLQRQVLNFQLLNSIQNMKIENQKFSNFKSTLRENLLTDSKQQELYSLSTKHKNQLDQIRTINSQFSKFRSDKKIFEKLQTCLLEKSKTSLTSKLHVDKLMQLKMIPQSNETHLNKWLLRYTTHLLNENKNLSERVQSEESFFHQRNERRETPQLFTSKIMELQVI